MADLAELLERAARSDWERDVLRRCAWCGRVANAAGVFVLCYAIEPETVMSDGMCPPCGEAALSRLRAARAA